MFANLFGGQRVGLRIAFVLVVSLLVGLLVWFIVSSATDNDQPKSPLTTEAGNTPLPLDGVGDPNPPLPLDIQPETGDSAGTDALGLPSKGDDQPEPGLGWSGWQLLSIDGVEVSPAGAVTIRCRAMSTDRIPNDQVLGQLVYQIGQDSGADPVDFHVSQINNYYRCDLDLEWSAIVVGYGPGVCLDLSPLNGALSLTAGGDGRSTDHPALAPWIGSGCSADPEPGGQISVETSQPGDGPALAEVVYRGTFRVFVPKNDYSKIIASIWVEIEPGVYGILEPVRIERL